MPEISAALRAEVRSRAKGRCEYCLVPESLTLVTHEVDHIIAAKHGGATLLDKQFSEYAARPASYCAAVNAGADWG
jgi:hypothetical protein